MKSRASSGLARLFYAFFALCFTWLFFHIVVNGGYYNYQEALLLFCILSALILIMFCGREFQKHEAFLDRHGRLISVCFLSLMFVLQIIFGLRLRYKPVFDVDAIFGAAVEWAETGSFPSYYEYYSYFFNNFGALRFLYQIFRLTRALGSSDYFLAATLANGLLSVLTMFVTGSVAHRLLGAGGRVTAYLLFLLSPPFLFIAPAFYTDALSMLFPVLIYWLYLLAKEQPTLRRRLVFYLLMGLAASLGIQLKPTVAIVLVAIVIDAALFGSWKRLLPMAAIVLSIVILGQLNMSAAITRHLDRDMLEHNRTPVLHWVMMGLKGSGGYNRADYEFTRSFDDPDERDRAIRTEIKTRLDSLGAAGLVKLLSKKSDICFGDGTYGLSDCLGGKEQQETRLHELLLKGGKYYDIYRHVCAGVLLAMYVLMIASGWQEVFQRGSGSLAALVPRLAVFGLLLFLLFWEARWRYFSNYIPLIMLSALLGLEPFCRAMDRLGRRLLPLPSPQAGPSRESEKME